MSILFVLIPLALVLLAGAIWAFFWAVSSGQFDDLDTPAWRILTDTDAPSRPRTDDAEHPEEKG
ncbi:cbb3-type cytochrome oxidase assembly protein CcoS [Arhodomonas sp. AD133]|uniref:cbb3-type cytochrome oxidase assembly protein CcoS n=1 Tax=Arhodomonas sp. AD133 TaxID=3415009 RepID=UPI003EBD339B